MTRKIVPTGPPDPSLPLLNPQREAFAIAYSQTGSGLASARMARFTSLGQGSRLVNDEVVAARIRYLNAQQFRQAGITAERVKQELARVAFASGADLFDDEGRLIGMHDLPDDVAATITGIDVEVTDKIVKDEDGNPTVEHVIVKKVRRADKMAALGLLARHFKIVGAEEDGVNALANVLADRLNAAKRRLEPQPTVIDSSDIEDAVIIEPTTPAVLDPQPSAESSDEQLW